MINGCGSNEKKRQNGTELTIKTTASNTKQEWQATPVLKTWEEAKEYCANLDLNNQTDWRLPSSEDFFTLLDGNRSIDEYFPKSSLIKEFYTNNKTDFDENQIWKLSAWSNTLSYTHKSKKLGVRCVRGEKKQTPELIWKPHNDQTFTWNEANSYCKNQNARVPTILELIKLHDINQTDNFIPFWSSTPLPTNHNQYLNINYKKGIYFSNKETKNYVKCVKNKIIPTISVYDTNFSEDGNSNFMVLNINPAPTQDLQITYTLTSGSAKKGVDFDETNQTLTIKKETPLTIINIPIINDHFPEDTESFYITLSNPINAKLKNITAKITILDDDSQNSAFITKWKTTSANESITIPTKAGFYYNYSVDWGDGNQTTNHTGNATHTYTNPGKYTIKIFGIFPSIDFTNSNNQNQILSINQWGSVGWQNLDNAFYNCINLELNATDTLNFQEQNISIDKIFFNTSVSNESISSWNVSNKIMPQSIHKTVDEDHNISIDLRRGYDDNLTYHVETNTTNGSLNIDNLPTIIYTPNENFNGSDSFIFRVSDDNNFSDTATVTITINPINDPPNVNINIIGAWEVGESIIFESNSSDVDGDFLTYQWEENGVSISTNDQNFTKTYTDEGNYTITLIVSDPYISISKSIDINITNPPFKLPKTGQVNTYHNFDDGYYQKGSQRVFTKFNNMVKDKNLNLFWQDDNNTIIKKTFIQAYDYCDNLTLNAKNDWRLPTKHELFFLAKKDTNETLEDIFSYKKYDQYWSSGMIDTATSIITIDFSNATEQIESIDEDYYVRCVRSDIDFYPNISSSNGIITDHTLNLMWYDSSEFLNYSDAINRCEDLNISNYNDWRVPNINELYTIQQDFFPNIAHVQYWSSTAQYDTNGSKIYTFDFSLNLIELKNSIDYAKTVCVRDIK